MRQEKLSQEINTIRELLFLEKNLEIQTEPFATGSWGKVYRVEAPRVVHAIEDGTGAIVEGLALKLPRDDSLFLTEGDLAREFLEMEVTTGLRQANVGIPPTLAVVGVSVDDTLVSLRNPKHSDVVGVIMPLFSEEKRLAEMLERGEEVSGVMDDVFNRLHAMRTEIPEFERSFDPVLGWHNLIIDNRMQNYFAREYPFSNQAQEVCENLSRWIGRLSIAISDRFTLGKVAEQHGDPRSENIVLHTNADGSQSGVILDAVRLAFREDQRLRREWFETDDLLQAGMLLGDIYAQEHKYFLLEGIDAYERFFGEDVLDDPDVKSLMGISLIYGMSVEAHVLGYDLELTSDKNIRHEKLEMYWEKMTQLAEDPRRWY